MTQTPITRLARFVTGLTPDSIPQQVTDQARLCLLDTLGCMIAGAQTDEAAQLRRAETATNPGSLCALAGGGRHSLLGAARINAYQGDIFELNDLIAGHASIGNVAAVLALGQAEAASGAEMLLALIAGIETTSRVYNAFYPDQKPLDEVGIVSVGPASSVGAAAACARLLGLDETATAHALSIAAAWANWCPAEVIFGDGGASKPMLFGGLPATSGITAALAAREGMTGPHHILSSDKGLFVTLATRWSPEAITTDSWALNAPRRKLHACCGYIHSAYDSVEQLVHDHRLAPGDVRSVDVAVPAYIVPAVGKDAPPRTPNEARFHMQYMLAQALCGAGPVTPALSNDVAAQFARPEIAAATGRINVAGTADLTHYHQSRVTLHLTDGRTLTAENDAPRGTAQNPLDAAAIGAKFDMLTTPVIGSESARRLRAHCLHLGEAPAADLFDLMQAPPR